LKLDKIREKCFSKGVKISMKFTCDYITTEALQVARWLISKSPAAFIKIPYHHLSHITT